MVMPMYLFPILYIAFFFLSLRYLFKGEYKGILLFIIFGLSIYTISLSVSNMYGFSGIIPVLQTFKEFSILCYLGYLFFNLTKKIHFHIIDKLMLAFFGYVLLYVFLPVGSYGFFQRVLAFKSLCFFPLVYFTGRIIDARKIHLAEIFHYIGLLSILAGGVLLIEVVTNTHLQTYSGYADYNYYFFDQEPSGDDDLSWTFQIENGMKRFASFFSAPLEYAAATLIALSAVAALVTNNQNRLRFSNFTILFLASTVLGISLALSRASFASYLVIVYAYLVITQKKQLLKIFHYSVIAAIAFFLLVSIKGDFFEFIINTVQFTNASSIGHVIEWLNGIESMASNPLGIGLGESGRISAFSGTNTGGENQFIIIGVQTGVIALAIYVTVYLKLIIAAAQTFKNRKGKIRKLALFIFLIKIGLFIPLFTAEVESYIYISYLVWFLSGLLVNMLSEKNAVQVKLSLAGLKSQN